MGVIPKIQVYNKVIPPQPDPNLAGRVCLIGAFENEFTTPQVVTSLTEAYQKLGTDTSFEGVNLLPILFNGTKNKDVKVQGVTSILAVNITTWTGEGQQRTADKSITPEKLTDAISKISREKFDILLVAGVLTTGNNATSFLKMITTFAEDRYLNKMPIGYIGAVDKSNIVDYVGNPLENPPVAGLVEEINDWCYGIIPNQTLEIDNVSYSLIETCAYYTALVCSTRVGNSLTQKDLNKITGLGTEFTFEDVALDEAFNKQGKRLVNAGFVVFDCYDRENQKFVIVNSEQPNGYDLYINRVRDYVVREFALRQFLGEKNRPVTLMELSQEITRVKNRCVTLLDFLEDIEYNVEKVNSHCVNVIISRLLFAGIITEINVYITIEVE